MPQSILSFLFKQELSRTRVKVVLASLIVFAGLAEWGSNAGPRSLLRTQTVYKTTDSGLTFNESFGTKFNATGNLLVYSTYLGSGQGGNDTARSIAVDSIGNDYVTGLACVPCTSRNSALNSIVNGAPGNSATATPAATLLTQFSQQGPKLVGSDAVGNDRQGQSVAISADGNTAIVGGNGGGQQDISAPGAAWVYTRSGGVWTQQGPKLVGSGAVGNAEQGFSVSISADGNTALVGGHKDNNNAGAAWVWTRSGGVWTQQGPKLVGSGAEGIARVGGAQQGYSVSLSGDGNTAIVGGISDNVSDAPDGTVYFAGAAWVWTRSGGVWTQQGPKLVGSGAANAATQGCSVSLSGDGNTAIVGGYFDNASNGSAVGAAWIWRRSGGVWTQQGNKLVGSGGDGDGLGLQGYSVALSADGNTAIVGGVSDSFSFFNGHGAAWVWTRSGGVWTQQGNKLVGSGAVGNANQGHSVSLSGDGNTAIVGGFADNFIGDDGSVGAVWVWARSGGAWTQQGNKLVGSGAVGSARQGWSVSLSADGNTAIVGGLGNNNFVGAAWVFTASTPTCSIAPLTSFANLATKYCSDLAITQELEANPVRTDLYSQSMQTAIADFQARVRNAGFTGPFLSATFRTLAYQAHLREVWDQGHKVAPFKVTPPECSTVASAIAGEFNKHFPKNCCLPGSVPIPPAPSKPGAIQHTVGRAIDVNITSISGAGIDTNRGGQLDQIASAAGFWRPYPDTDPVHLEPLFPVPVASPQSCSGTLAAAEARSTTSNAISESAVSPVTVKVSEQSINGHPVYSYRVVNSSSEPVVSATIGYDQPNDNPELAVAPLGWAFYNELPQSSITSPMGWSASVVPTEESSYLQLTWDADSSHAIAPGQSSDGFSVVLPNADNSYMNSHWTIVLADGTVYSGSLEPLNAATGDTVQFSQAVYTVNKDGGSATITVTRSGSTANSATVNFATSDGTAKQPINYTMASGSLTFAAGETSESFSVQITNNVYLEPGQTVNLNLSNASGLSLGNLSFATLVINNNSPSSSPTQLILETSGPAPDEAAALDSILFSRDPFPGVNGANLFNLGVDRNTRVIVFVMNLQLVHGETSSSVVVNLIDSNNQSYDTAAEDVRLVPHFDSTQVVFRLPDNLSAGTCTIKIKAHGQISNTGTIKIRI